MSRLDLFREQAAKFEAAVQSAGAAPLALPFEFPRGRIVPLIIGCGVVSSAMMAFACLLIDLPLLWTGLIVGQEVLALTAVVLWLRRRIVITHSGLEAVGFLSSRHCSLSDIQSIRCRLLHRSAGVQIRLNDGFETAYEMSEESAKGIAYLLAQSPALKLEVAEELRSGGAHHRS